MITSRATSRKAQRDKTASRYLFPILYHTAIVLFLHVLKFTLKPIFVRCKALCWNQARTVKAVLANTVYTLDPLGPYLRLTISPASPYSKS
jgi:hypothetical protein